MNRSSIFKAVSGIARRDSPPYREPRRYPPPLISTTGLRAPPSSPAIASSKPEMVSAMASCARPPQAGIEGAIDLLMEVLCPPSPARIVRRHVRHREMHRRRRLELRHGFATLHLALGTHVKVVQEALGPSDVATTLRIYSHVIPGMQHEAAKQIDAALRTHLEHGQRNPR